MSGRTSKHIEKRYFSSVPCMRVESRDDGASLNVSRRC